MWEGIQYVTGWATLAAFVVAIVATAFKWYLGRSKELIRCAPSEKRAELVKNALQFFNIETEGLTREQRFNLALKQINARSDRFTKVLWAFSVVSICGIVALTVFNSQNVDQNQPKSTQNEVKHGATQQTTDSKLVFLTSQSYSADFGGLTGADTICNALAKRSSLKGSFMAWLSDSRIGPRNRFKNLNTKYVLPNGTLVTESLANVLACKDGQDCLRNPINVYENGVIAFSPEVGSSKNRVWTATNLAGLPFENTCNNWYDKIEAPSEDLNDTVVVTGDPTSISKTWTNSYSENCPAQKLSLYCFEQ